MKIRPFLLILLFSLPLRAATTHYISSAIGSDSNSAAATQSKTTPWAHAPGMAGCTGNCATYTPSAGDRFIFRGGDTWTAPIGLHMQWAGTSGNPTTWGVDQTWFTGASWTRPIFDCQTTACGADSLGQVIYVDGNWQTLDNIEIKNYQSDANQSNIIFVNGANNTVSNNYIHAWSHLAGTCTGGNDPYVITLYIGGGTVTGNAFRSNVIDGSDSGDIGGNYCFGGIEHGNIVENNVIRYVYNGMNGVFDQIDGNLVEHNNVSTTGDHCNMVFLQALFAATTGYVYNNVIRHTGCSGGSTLWLEGNANSSKTVYAFNNVIYDVATSFSPVCIPVGNHPGNLGGPFFLYNNTCEAGGTYAFGNGECCQRFVTHISNNHIINGNGSVCDTTGTTCVDDGTELQQTTAQASANTTPHFDQYTSSETYAYSPTAATNSTVGTGTDWTSLCTGTLAALCSDTTYATYNTTSHTVAMRTVNARPGSGAWDIGAFEFSGASPAAPINLHGGVSIVGFVSEVTASPATSVIPAGAQSSTSIQTRGNWQGQFDPGTSGTATGTQSTVSSPSLSGTARQFVTSFTNNGGYLYYDNFTTPSPNTTALNWFLDQWIYLASPTTALANVETDLNQVDPSGNTIIMGFQCDGWNNKWDYTYTDTASHWTQSAQPCNPRNWTTNAWHHLQIYFSRDASDNVTYHSVWLDDAQYPINATVHSGLALGWANSNIMNFQIDGVGASGSVTAYLDNSTVYWW